jgi:hypothetical protein
VTSPILPVSNPFTTSDQGCQICLCTTYQNGKNKPKLPQNIPNVHQNLQTYINGRHSKIYRNWTYRFENIPSGNPASDPKIGLRKAPVRCKTSKQQKNKMETKLAKNLLMCSLEMNA